MITKSCVKILLIDIHVYHFVENNILLINWLTVKYVDKNTKYIEYIFDFNPRI